jgi:formimidoylglutamate deiminase
MRVDERTNSVRPELVEGPVPRKLWCPIAWLGTGSTQAWAHNVLLEIDSAGHWSNIAANVPRDAAQSQGATLVNGPLLPGVVNAHSHAFQRAFAGLAERRDSEHDDFWSWRDRMYRVALAISPEQLKAVASQLYLELLRGGYTQVCEFHYLHHAPDGSEYADPLLMAWTLADAAEAVGIGLTLLPVLYERAGFAASALRTDQRRFATNAAWVLNAQQRVNEGANSSLVSAGVAIHSLRAATPESIRELVDRASGPIHIHIAEQTGEVDECLKVTGLRPVEWLVQHHALDPRWQLIHATHVTQSEIDCVARSGASWATAPRISARGSTPARRSPSALTATSRATGAKSCACSNTGSACSIAHGIFLHRLQQALAQRQSGCSRAWWQAVRPRAVTSFGD